jgi:hypothetical protein
VVHNRTPEEVSILTFISTSKFRAGSSPASWRPAQRSTLQLSCRTQGRKKWKTLHDVDIVLAGCMDKRENQRRVEVYVTPLFNVVVLARESFRFVQLSERLIDVLHRGDSVATPFAAGVVQVVACTT